MDKVSPPTMFPKLQTSETTFPSQAKETGTAGPPNRGQGLWDPSSTLSKFLNKKCPSSPAIGHLHISFCCARAPAFGLEPSLPQDRD